MADMLLEFEWDRSKDKSNLSKHGVSFEEAAGIFGDIFSIEMPDPEHSEPEERWISIGLSGVKCLVVIWTIRGERTRIISARRADRDEADFYWSQR